MEMQTMLEAVNHHAAAFGLRINTSKPKVMSVRIPGEQNQAVLPDGETLKGTEEVRSKIDLLCSSFSRLQSCLCSQREISFRPKGRVYQTVGRTFVLYDCETWPIRVADKRVLTMTV